MVLTVLGLVGVFLGLVLVGVLLGSVDRWLVRRRRDPKYVWRDAAPGLPQGWYRADWPAGADGGRGDGGGHGDTGGQGGWDGGGGGGGGSG